MFQLNNILFSLYPELLVLVAIIIAIVFSTTERFKNAIWVFSVLLLTDAAAFIVQNQLFLSSPQQILGGAYITDSLSVIFRLLILLTGILIIIGSVKYNEGFIHKGEYQALMLTAILGAMILVSANDLITIFVSLETLGLSSIMLAGYSKYDERSNEAAIKYLLNSAAATAIFLFGLSILYGLTGSTQLYEIKYVLTDLYSGSIINSSIIFVMIVTILGGLAFKLACAPMHMWSPDVYDGSPTPTTAFLAVCSKAAAVALSIRILCYLFDFAISIWQPVLIFMAILSMLIGNLIALSQAKNQGSIKRLMAYSSIAQIGYILIGIIISTPESISASIYYMIIYAIMNTGAFLCIIAFGNEADSDSISDYKGLITRRPFLSVAFAICLFNLGGLPFPPAGFIAKFILIKSAFAAGNLGFILAVVALITTVVSIFYYSYIVKLMFADEPSKAVQNMGFNRKSLGECGSLNASIKLALIGIFLITLYAYPILNLAKDSVKNLCTSCPIAISYKR